MVNEGGVRMGIEGRRRLIGEVNHYSILTSLVNREGGE